MLIFPAIDIKSGKCVRLTQGDFATATQVANSAVDTAIAYQEAGASWLHMVDLDGSLTGSTTNFEVLKEVVSKTKLNVQIGGGIRDTETIERYLMVGVKRIILGSVAAKDKEFTKKSLNRYGKSIAIGIDAKSEKVATEGWTETTDIHYIDLAKQMEQMGADCIIYTDISKDGTLQGINTEHLTKLSQAVSCNIIASGGVAGIADIAAASKMGLYGIICGKALYNGALNLQQALSYEGELC